MVFKKILIIRFSSIGDIVLTSPVVRCLKQQLNAEIHYLTKQQFSELLVSNPYISKVWTIRSKISECSKELKQEQFDAIIDLHNNLRSRLLSIVLGLPCYRFDKLNFKKWLAVQFKWNLLPKKHLVDRYFEKLSAIGIKNDGEGLEYFLPNDMEQQLERLNLPGVYSVGVLGATYYTKQIPQELWEKIIPECKGPVVLIGGKNEAGTGAHLKNKFPGQVTNYAGSLSLSLSAAVINNAELVITPDTGMMHIAAAFKKPMHVFWGNTIPDFGMFPYFGKDEVYVKNHEVEHLKCRPCSKLGFDSCPKSHFNCMKNQRFDL